MAIVTKDYIGQTVELGDWCCVTQHNQIAVGKVVKKGRSVQIAIDTCHEHQIFWKKDKNNSDPEWKQRNDSFVKKFGFSLREYHDTRYKNSCWMLPKTAKDGKFVKITPTDKMQREYDFKRESVTTQEETTTTGS